MKTIKIPNYYGFRDHGVYDFESAIKIYDWSIEGEDVLVDFSSCFTANYQALSLLVLYIWNLKDKGCFVTFKYSEKGEGASKMWRQMGAIGWSQVLRKSNQNFKGSQYKPLIGLRNQTDFSKAVAKAEEYTKGFNVEYEKTLRYVISELLYNTLEHGQRYMANESVRMPSIIQFTWYKNSNELQFIVADLGIGIKKHLEQTYPGQESDSLAIKYALQYQVSGTFNVLDPYKNKNNAGVGLFISSNIIRKLNADMHVLSGKGLVHISPRDTTLSELSSNWPGTLVLVTLRLGVNTGLNLHKIMSELRASAEEEIKRGSDSEKEGKHYLGIANYFGVYAEDKDEAVKYRDTKLMPAIQDGQAVVLDFSGVKGAPHSFLSALLATPIKTIGMKSYKIIQVINAEPEIRETIDYILDDNT